MNDEVDVVEVAVELVEVVVVFLDGLWCVVVVVLVVVTVVVVETGESPEPDPSSEVSSSLSFATDRLASTTLGCCSHSPLTNSVCPWQWARHALPYVVPSLVQTGS